MVLTRAANAARMRERRRSAPPADRERERERGRRRRAEADDSDREREASRGRRRRREADDEDREREAERDRRRRRRQSVGDAGLPSGGGEEQRSEVLISTQPQEGRGRREAPWWDKLEALTRQTVPLRLRWEVDPCSHCGAILLTTERRTFCCGGGTHVLPRLAPYPPEIEQLRIQAPSRFAKHSRSLNGLFCFTTLGTTGGFLSQNDPRLPGGEPTVVLTGRTYHHVRPVDKPGHSVFWMLYDQPARDSEGTALQIPPEWIPIIQDALSRSNFFCRTLLNFATFRPAHHATLEFRYNDAAPEIAALMYTNNRATIGPRSIAFQRRGDTQPTFVNSLSPFYEPLH
ncbi:hypothetical protein P7C70_g3982, partial [Phenoliferia sp. Uapishka_3]